MNAPPSPQPTRPALDLTIAAGPDGRSRLAARHVAFPWSLGRGYPGDPGQPVMLIPQVAGAGLLAGDHVSQRIRVADGAALHLHSAGAMLTYGTPDGAPSTSDWAIDIGHGARAHLLSEPYVLFDNAALILRQTITLDPVATVVACEGIVTAPGARACHWQTETQVRRPDGTPLFTDRQRASPASLARHGTMGGRWTSFGTLMVFTGEGDTARAALDRATQIAHEGAWIGMAPMPRGLGMTARVAAPDGQTLREALMLLAKAAVAVL